VKASARNPLASPAILGIVDGATLGADLFVLLFSNGTNALSNTHHDVNVVTSFWGAKGERIIDKFGDGFQLLVYHFMFGPTGKASCSFWADSFNGLAPHLAEKDIAFVAVSSTSMSMITPSKSV
jgi:ABC-type Fe3+-siderophore transport system permease subunit